MKSIAVVILTFNEEKHIFRAIESVKKFADEIFVIDSFSSDRTVEISLGLGATVLQNKFVNQAKQFQWGLENASIRSEWIMRLDADEVVEPPLVEEILVKLPHVPTDVVAINLKRKHIFSEKWIRFGGRYPLLLTRLWRKGHGEVEDRWMDEHVVVWGGRTIEFRNSFSDHNLNDLTYFIEKHNRYATREAIEVLGKRYGLFEVKTKLTVDNSSRQASTKRILKEKIYNNVPFYISSTSYFVYRYFFQFGFLDGLAGLQYHFFQGLWYRFLVGAKVREYEKVILQVQGVEARRAKLFEVTGLPDV